MFFFLSFLGVWVTSLPCPALGVVPATDPTLILAPAGASSLVMAHILQENGKVPVGPSSSQECLKQHCGVFLLLWKGSWNEHDSQGLCRAPYGTALLFLGQGLFLVS